jgi:hypothetical protein
MPIAGCCIFTAHQDTSQPTAWYQNNHELVGIKGNRSFNPKAGANLRANTDFLQVQGHSKLLVAIPAGTCQQPQKQHLLLLLVPALAVLASELQPPPQCH